MSAQNRPNQVVKGEKWVQQRKIDFVSPSDPWINVTRRGQASYITLFGKAKPSYAYQNSIQCLGWLPIEDGTFGI